VTCDPWPVDRTKLPDLPDEDDPGYDAAVEAQENAIKIAVHLLWALTGRVYGVCETKARPCTTGIYRPPFISGWSPDSGFNGRPYLIWSGSGWSTDACGCGATCVASGPYAAHLPGPVYPEDATHPITVLIGGDVLDHDHWVLEGDVLYRRDAPWPSQNMGKPDGEDCTWSVIYWRGLKVPAYVGVFVGTLAAEMLAAAAGENCRLPASVRRVSRQGVSMEIDPASIVQSGMTGLLEIDRWIASLNPHRLMQPPSVI
jgi:hypothetical protein